MANVKVLNTADLLPKEPLILKIDGVDHTKVDPSLEDVVQTLKDLEDLAKAPSLLEELQFVIRIITRAFPTITEEMLRKWPANVVNEIYLLARDEDQPQVETKDAEGNDKPAS